MRRANGQKAELWDDCGAGKKASCPKALWFNQAGKLITPILRNGEYCVEKSVKCKREYIPLEPQPTKEDVLELHRSNQTLKASTSMETFKRRVTCFGNIPTSYSFIPSNMALVEYIGKYPGLKLHGNAKNPNRNKIYIKTKKAVSTKLKEQLNNCSVKDVEKNMNHKTDDDFEKQLRTFKFNLNKKDRPNSNAADHVIAVEEMTKTDEFVQNVNHPVVTLFNTQHILDIKRFCCKDGGEVLSMDKTFTLGDSHVTPAVYKDTSVVRRTSLGHSICFGPTFIHTSSTTKTYSAFLHQIADNLKDSEIKTLVIGSDAEASFKSAIKRCFPEATHILCTRHLKNNAMQYMEDICGNTNKRNTQYLFIDI